MKKTVVVSIGGSRIVPDEVDHEFLQRLREVLNELKGYKFVICTGGGHTARDYIKALAKDNAKRGKQDKIGIEVTRLNAKLVMSFLKKCNSRVPKSLTEIKSMLKKNDVVVCGGLKPGRTSDGTTAEIAKHLGSDIMINVTNVKGLYTKDPKKYKSAKFIPKIMHKAFKKMMDAVVEKPGMHFVLDSYAEKITRRNNIQVLIIDKLKEMKNYLQGKKYKGTLIY